MLFFPWRNEETDILSGFPTYKDHYDSIKRTIDAKNRLYEHHVEELVIARHVAEAEYAAYDEIAPSTQQEERDAEDEGEVDAAEFVYFNPDRIVEHRQYDIGIEFQSILSVPCIVMLSYQLKHN